MTAVMVDTGQQESFAAAPCAGMTDSTAVPTPACPEEASTDGKCFSDFYNKAIETSSSPTVQLQQPDDQGQVPTASAAHSQLPLTAAVAGPDSKEPQDPSAAVYRLKIVGIPAGYSEDQLRSLFQLCGTVAEARIVHDKQSGRPVGYGYVSFFTKEAADLAISTFDDQLQLQGGVNYLSVYYAKKQHDTVNDKESCPARNAKLYFCGTPAGLRRDSILALFSAFGRVRHLQVYTDSYGVLSSGTVTMYSTDEAIAAMNSLDGKVLQAGTAPLKVTWAQLSTLPRRNPSGGGPPPPMPRGFTVSYACIPTSVTPAEVAATFERYGMVLQVVPFAHRREGPTNSRGCGLVVMESEPAAMAAVEALSGVLTWPGAERPLLVQPFYGTERVGANQLASLDPAMGGPGGQQQPGGQFGRSSAGGGGGVGGGSAGGMRGPTNHNSAASAGPRGHAGGRGYGGQQHWGPGGGQGPNRNGPNPPAGLGLDGASSPPPGCAPDAFKLVLMNLPGSYTQSDIMSLLQPYGTVVSLTHVPAADGSGDSTVGVWFQNGPQADAALAALSNTVLMAAEGSRQLQLKAFKGPPGRFAGGHTRGPMQQQGARGQAGGGWPSPSATQGLTGLQQHHSPGLGAYQQQQQPLQHHMSGSLVQGGFGAVGQAQLLQQQQQQQGRQMLGGDQGSLLMQGAGGVSAGPPGLTGMGAGSQLAALAAATAAMNAAPQPYSMQQLLYMLPQQQPGVLDGASPAGGTWAGGTMMPGGGMGFSTSSNIDPNTMQSMHGATDPSLLAQAVATTAALLGPHGGTGYTGWLG